MTDSQSKQVFGEKNSTLASQIETDIFADQDDRPNTSYKRELNLNEITYLNIN